MDETAIYRRYMDERIRLACEHRKAYGQVPAEEVLDRLLPIPRSLVGFFAHHDEQSPYLARITKRDRTYGLCGICYSRGRWVGRMEYNRKQWTKSCDTALQAVRWYNKMELKLRKKKAVLASEKAAALVDAGVIEWEHVSAISRGKAHPRPEILALLKEGNDG